MVSSTQQTERRRTIRLRRAGRKNTKENLRRATPAFPIHPEGYDPKAPDAKPVASDSPSSSES